MSFAPFTKSTIPHRGKCDPRRLKINAVIIHHGAQTDYGAHVRTLTGDREVSANYCTDGRGNLIGQVPDEYRAWTSGSPYDNGRGAEWDHRALTVETLNSTGAPTWSISAADETALVRLVRYAHDRYGVPLDRDHIVGHRELYERWGASYPTACPGGIDIDRIVKRAKKESNDMAITNSDLNKIAQRVWSYGMSGGKPTADGTVPKESAGERIRQVRRSTYRLQGRTMRIEQAVTDLDKRTAATDKTVKQLQKDIAALRADLERGADE